MAGQSVGPPAHVVYDPADSLAHQVCAVQRRPATERWSLEALQAVTALPRVLRQPATAGVPEPIEILPPVEDPAAVPPPTPPSRAPNRVFITDEDMRACGYTAGCPRCMHMRVGLPCRGVKHREACRQRVETYLREVGGPLVIAVDNR